MLSRHWGLMFEYKFTYANLDSLDIPGGSIEVTPLTHHLGDRRNLQFLACAFCKRPGPTAESAVSFVLTPLGDSALILRVGDSLGEVLAVVHKLEAARLPGVVEIAPAFASVAVFLKSPEYLADCAASIPAALDKGRRAAAKSRASRLLEVPVCYDAAYALDLEEVAEHCGLSPNEVVTCHAAAHYHVRCIGFTPGFPYLSGLPDDFDDTASSNSPHDRAGRIGCNRGPAGWHLSAPLTRRMEHYWPNPASSFRRHSRAGSFVRARRSTAFCGNHA